MTRALARLLLVAVPVLAGVAGCAAHTAPTAASPSASASAVQVSRSASAVVMPAGGQNPEAAIPNPGTGTGNPLLVRALLPQSAAGREAAFLLPPAVVALPDRDRRSLFIGLRQYASPVVGPQACEPWTAGLAYAVVTSFNRPGGQLGITEQGVPTAAGSPMFSEAILTGPPSMLDALSGQALPAACRVVTTPNAEGGIKPQTLQSPVPGAVSARAFEVTGTGKFPVWIWAEVVEGRGFVLEIRIPVQSGSRDPGTALPALAAAAYQRAAATLAPA